MNNRRSCGHMARVVIVVGTLTCLTACGGASYSPAATGPTTKATVAASTDDQTPDTLRCRVRLVRAHTQLHRQPLEVIVSLPVSRDGRTPGITAVRECPMQPLPAPRPR
jgi:hypothetical protein